jgi:hypothetical protein
MIANFLKITFRNLRKNSSYSLLNIFGLAIGITCAGLIFLWVENDVSYDRFLPKKDRLALIWLNQTIDGRVRTFSASLPDLDPVVGVCGGGDRGGGDRACYYKFSVDQGGADEPGAEFTFGIISLI